MSPSDEKHNRSTGTSTEVPRFVVELEPWGQTFSRNLRDAFSDPSTFRRSVFPRSPWPDVFVDSPLPLRALSQSTLFHVFIFVVVYGLSLTLFYRANAPKVANRNTTITYYNLSEYLPAMESGGRPARVARRGRPAFSRQRIISLPATPDNTSQTIVNPVAPRLIRQPVKLPNIVVWTPVPQAAPVASSARTLSQLKLPGLIAAPIMPEPDTRRTPAQIGLPKLGQTSIIEPPPEILRRRIGSINVGHFENQVAAPKLPVPEQRASAGGSEGEASAPPPPGLAGGGTSPQAVGQFIALGLNPEMPNGPISIPQGSRSGIFAATPEGKPGAPGTPDIASGGSGPGGRGTGASGPGSGSGGAVPGGISISGGGPGPGAIAGPTAASLPSDSRLKTAEASENAIRRRTLMADAQRPRRARADRDQAEGSPGSPYGENFDDQVFKGKKYYSLTLNMPNLTSAGGSWIIRFSELNASRDRSELTAPVPVKKVDPAYPPDLMQDGIEGTVVLYAVIRSDGTVDDVSVIEGVQERLDENARLAMTGWRFRPALKNGAPVDLEAVVRVPFKARRRMSF